MFFNGRMTLSVRNGLLAAAFTLLLLWALGLSFLAFVLLAKEGWSAPVGTGTLLELLLQTGPLPLGSIVAFLWLRGAYRKSGSPEVFFFAMFAVCLSAEALLLVQAWVSLQGLSLFYTSLLTRTAWAFRFIGIALLFCGSLFAFNFTYRKYGNLVAACIVTGIALATVLPLHSTTAHNHLLFAVGDASGLVLVNCLVALIVGLNHFMGSRRPEASERATARAWACLFFLLGWTAAILAGPWGAWLATPGVVLAVWKAEQNPLLG